MHHLHGILCRLYPGFPTEPAGILQVRLQSGDEWIHVESDELGVRSPYRDGAVRHLHVCGEYWDGERLRSSIVLFSAIGPPANVFAWDRLQRDGIVAFNSAAWPTIWIPTAAADSIEAGPVRKVWTEMNRGYRRSAPNQTFCLALANDLDARANILAPER